MCGTKMEEKKAQAERKKEEGRLLLGQIMLWKCFENQEKVANSDQGIALQCNAHIVKVEVYCHLKLWTKHIHFCSLPGHLCAWHTYLCAVDRHFVQKGQSQVEHAVALFVRKPGCPPVWSRKIRPMDGRPIWKTGRSTHCAAKWSDTPMILHLAFNFVQ